jgi:SAM-dependent methyltransferase
MPYNITRFAHHGMSWSDRSHLGELSSGLYAGGSERKNLLMHAATLVSAKAILALNRKNSRNKGVLLDFGCGSGRMLRFFGNKGWSVIGTEITAEMLSETRKLGVPQGSELFLTDGVSVPLRNQSVDMIWVCGVLKYSLFEPDSACRGGSGPDKVAVDTSTQSNGVLTNEPILPVYPKIAKEMHRVLKPGGFVVNVEMWVDAPPEAFTADFERIGFVTKKVRVLRRYLGLFEKLLEWRDWRRLPPGCVIAAGQLVATLRYWFDDPRRMSGGLRDYLFVWFKPKI